MTPAVWALSPISKGRNRTRSLARRWRFSPTSTTAGAVGADPLLGDGAGILMQIPDPLYRKWAESEGLTLPPQGDYAVAMCFLPQEDAARDFITSQFEKFIVKEGQQLIGWRDVPTTEDGLGKAVLASMPVIRQCFIGRGDNCEDQDAFERKLIVIRKQTQNPLRELAEEKRHAGDREALHAELFEPHRGLQGPAARHPGRQLLRRSARSRTASPRSGSCTSASRTNTFPSWRLAQPFRLIAHNGEINTVRGNVNWMNARRRTMESELLGPDLDKLWPIVPHGQSDTACLDNALELLLLGGYSLAHAMMMLIPEAWARNPQMDPARKAFYEYHAALMEPWDGPAAVAFTDGRQIAATLDRNGLRPARFCVTHDDLCILASESGVLPLREDDIVRKWRLQPGRMLLIDLEEGRIIEDEELKAELANAEPYAKWLQQAQYKLGDLEAIETDHEAVREHGVSLLDRQQAFGYTQEDLSKFLEPMAVAGDDPIGSMGTDTPLAVLSNRSRLLYDYFKQNFAQVTNPPIDPIREELVMSLLSMIGPRPNLLGHEAGTHKRLEVDQPILTNTDLEKIRSVETSLDGAFRTETIDITWDAATGAEGLEMAIKEMCWAATEAVLQDRNILILSDRAQGPDRIPMPGAAGDRGGAPPPGAPGPAHADRAGGRNRRSARGAPFLRARGLRRGGDQSLPRVRDDRALARREVPRARRQGGRARITSRRSARASRRSCPRWASRPTSPIAARRFSTRSACRAISSRSTSPAPRPRSKVPAWMKWPRKRCAATPPPMATTRSTSTCSMSAASTSTACAARTMPGRRTASPTCSTRCAATTSRATKSSPGRSTSSPSAC